MRGFAENEGPGSEPEEDTGSVSSPTRGTVSGTGGPDESTEGQARAARPCDSSQRPAGGHLPGQKGQTSRKAQEGVLG